MKKEDLKKKSLGFEYDPDLDEFHKKSIDKSPGGYARFELLRNGKRVGKFYWDEIGYVYDRLEKPSFEIITLHGFNMNIFQDEYVIWIPLEKWEDSCYIRHQPIHFDTIRFYLEFEWEVIINDLKKR